VATGGEEPELDAERRNLLAGRVAFVTGAARGIGYAVAERFVDQGARVAVADVDATTAKQAAEQLSLRHPGCAIAVAVDITDEEQVRTALELTVKEFGSVDIVIVNAGILVLNRAVDLPIADWRRVIDVNLTGAFITARAAAAILIKQARGGRIIFTGSLMARRGAAENAAYSASKFGLMGLMETMAIELAPFGINVTAVNPGQIQTEMLDRLFVTRGKLTGSTPDQVRQRMLDHVPLGRLGTTAEVADAFVFLASDLSRYITGQALNVEGGWSLP
jgi:NAD(P)-dependent dehydrogenase (short-subunit alcohol dehydrogenase family)